MGLVNGSARCDVLQETGAGSFWVSCFGERRCAWFPISEVVIHLVTQAGKAV